MSVDFDISPDGKVRYRHPDNNHAWLAHPRDRCGSWPEQPTFPLAHPHFAADMAAFRELLRRKDVLPGQNPNELPTRRTQVTAALQWVQSNGFFCTATDFDDSDDLAIAREIHPAMHMAPLREKYQ